MKVAIYARVSTDKQELEQQIEACRKYCLFKGFKIWHIYKDIGSGADWFKRPGFNELLAALRRYEYKAVVVFRLDRLGRNARECLTFFDEMEDKGIDIYSLSENLDTSTAIGRAMRSIIAVLAQLERDNISEATKQRMQALKNLGKHVGRPPGAKDKTKRKTSGYFGKKNASKKGGAKN